MYCGVFSNLARTATLPVALQNPSKHHTQNPNLRGQECVCACVKKSMSGCVEVCWYTRECRWVNLGSGQPVVYWARKWQRLLLEPWNRRNAPTGGGARKTWGDRTAMNSKRDSLQKSPGLILLSNGFEMLCSVVSQILNPWKRHTLYFIINTQECRRRNENKNHDFLVQNWKSWLWLSVVMTNNYEKICNRQCYPWWFILNGSNIRILITRNSESLRSVRLEFCWKIRGAGMNCTYGKSCQFSR